MCRTPPRAIRLLFFLCIFSLPGLWATGQDCTKIASDYHIAVVSITVEVKDKKTGTLVDKRYGTGFIITSDGFVLTAHHVVDADPDVDEVDIKGAVGSLYGYKSPLKLLNKLEDHDIALLQFLDESSPFKAVPLGDPWGVQLGQRLCSLGFSAPMGMDQHVSSGILSNRNRANSLWVTTMPSNKGESGGPVFDVATSRVVAIKVGKVDGSGANVNAENVNYITPINYARRLIEEYTNLSLSTRDAQQDRPPALLCVENPGDTHNSMDTLVEAECEGNYKQTAHSTSWAKRSIRTSADGPNARAEASLALTCQRNQDDYVLGLTAQHSSMAGGGGTADDYRPSISSIKGSAVTGFTVERGNYCLMVTQYMRDGERKKGYPESADFPEGSMHPTLIVLESPTGKLIKLRPGSSIPLDDTGFWRFKIDINTAHSSSSREDSGHVTMENLLQFRFASRVQGGECPSPGDSAPPK